MKYIWSFTENIYLYISFAILQWFITSVRKLHMWFQKFMHNFSGESFQWQKAEMAKMWIAETDVNIGQQLS